MAKQLGIDLGTANTLIYLKGKGIILRAPSVVALENQSRSVIAVGSSAKKMLGKNPSSISVFKPLKDGVIADFEVTCMMLNRFFEMTEASSFFSRPSVIICTPYGITEVERRAVEDAVIEAGSKSVALVEEPIAAAIGAGIRVGSPRGNMIVDIGGGSTEGAIISLGGVVISRSLKVAGEKLDEAIVNYIKNKYNVLIGSVSAEMLKKNIGSVHPLANRGTMQVSGRNLSAGGLATTIAVSSEDIREALREPMDMIISTIKGALEATPPEISSDLYDYGMLLTGGGALLRGLDRFLHEATGLPVFVGIRPLDCVAEGAGKTLEGSAYIPANARRDSEEA
jgi:rod shape-determining protein MreB